MVKTLRQQCIELLTEIEARLDFDDEMPQLDVDLVKSKICGILQDVENALETANYDKLLQSGLKVFQGLGEFRNNFLFYVEENGQESLYIMKHNIGVYLFFFILGLLVSLFLILSI